MSIDAKRRFSCEFLRKIVEKIVGEIFPVEFRSMMAMKWRPREDRNARPTNQRRSLARAMKGKKNVESRVDWSRRPFDLIDNYGPDRARPV